MNGIDLDSWELLNVIDTRSETPVRRTIAYNKEIRPFEKGFTHNFRYRTKNGSMWGCGIVINPEYANMSSAEIILRSMAEDPITDDDRSKFITENDIIVK